MHQYYFASSLANSGCTMIALIYIASLVSLACCGLITHDLGEEDAHKATSYQDIHMEHFHAVPTYVKKEYKHLLEHPIPVGKSRSKLEVHHGGKHDHGYAIVDAENNAHGSGGHEDGGFSGHEGAGLEDRASAALGNGASGAGGYEVHDQNQELLQLQLARATQSHGGGGLQLQALGHGGAAQAGGGFAAALGQYHAAAAASAAAAGGHHDFEAAALQLQQGGLGGHGHGYSS